LWEFTNCEHLDVELQFVVQLDVYNLTSKEYVKKGMKRTLNIKKTQMKDNGQEQLKGTKLKVLDYKKDPHMKIK
jgi:hypothetical protein